MRFAKKINYMLLAGMLLFFLTDQLNAAFLQTRKQYPQQIPDNALKNRIFPCDKRFSTFHYVLNLLSEREVKTIVETGTARNGECNCTGDGCSTPIWGEWARENNARVYSVDIDPKAVQDASKACIPYENYVTFVTSDSVEFLANFNKPIDFLYLDSYDFDFSNPIPSQEHHLKEIIAVYSHLHNRSIIMIDDCDLPFGGKGALVIPYLLERGWKIALSEYQVILIYE